MHRCEVCNKTKSSGNKLNYKGTQLTKRTKRTRFPNIQRVRVIAEGQPTRLNVCTTCLKSNKVTRAV
ncbi:MAG: 50S ribosomal protein L28 [Firmicutes bacterium]|nr:50S ribosomal protein L28 [candidate division NPL-UPA2 bacterium]MBT9153424.1 50S ribosomal protein L28 [candidate division NPL-UPA2 bacterium]MBT9155738.1 50S ribosomal protein L28 [candidate division NPL-UPA2 bacterium]